MSAVLPAVRRVARRRLNAMHSATTQFLTPSFGLWMVFAIVAYLHGLDGAFRSKTRPGRRSGYDLRNP